MKYIPLILANLRRRKLRSILTVLSVALALFLFSTLRSVGTTLDSFTEAGSETRMIVRNASGITFSLPMAVSQRLAAVPNVSQVSWASWFGAWYRDPKDFFANFAVDGESFLDMYREIVVPPDQKAAWLANRTGALVGVDLMEKYGWRLGQNVTLNGTIYPGDWSFTIVATYTVTNKSFDELSFLFHYTYLEEATERRATPGWYYISLDDPNRAADVALAIDTQYKNSSAPTRTETEKAFNAGFMTMFGNVKFLMTAIGTAVVFAILLITGNAMMMSARERTPQIAVLKTLGYGSNLLFTLEMAEAGAIAMFGALLGVGGATLLWGNVEPFGAFLPGFKVTTSTQLVALGLAVMLTVVSGLAPALRAAKLSVVQALRRVE